MGHANQMQLAASLVAKHDLSIKCNGSISDGKLRDLSNEVAGKNGCVISIEEVTERIKIDLMQISFQEFEQE